MRKFADEDGVAVNITLFEKTDRIGGRSLTVDPFGNTSQRVELGASIFIAENYILTDAAREFRLPLREPYDDDVIPLMGIWDGDEFVLTVDTSNSWWMTLKILWKYGVTSPRATQKLVASSVAKFLKLYDKEYFPFRSLTQRVYDLELAALTGSTGEQLLKANGVCCEI